MTTPAPAPVSVPISSADTERGRQHATLGIGLIAAAAIGLAAFESIAHRRVVFTGVARMVLIVLLGLLVYRGRRWAMWLFGFFALGGALAGVIGLVGTQFSVVGVMLFAPIIAANLAGIALLFFSPAARDFLRGQQALAASAKRHAPTRAPNG
jgi:hypothetical protein